MSTTVTPANRSKASTAKAAWGELNLRQQVYLIEVYRLDQRAEERARSAFNDGDRAGKAADWRWVRYGTVGVEEALPSPLWSAISGRGLRDPGTGSTFAALADRGLIEQRHDNGFFGPVLFVK